MSTQENKALVRRYYEEVLTRRDPTHVDELFASNYEYHIPDAPPRLPSGLEGFKQFVPRFLFAFPDLKIEIEDQVAEGDKVATRFVAHGTVIGPLKSIPTTPQTAAKLDRVNGTSIERLSGGKIVESWLVLDQAGSLELLQQLGLTSSMEKAGQERS